MTGNVSETKIQTICLAVIATAVVTYFIFWLRPVLVPFVVSVFVVSGITPVLETLERRLHVHRMVAAAITFLAGLMMLAALGVSLWLSVEQMSDEGGAYRARIGQLLQTVEQWFDSIPGIDFSRAEGERESAEQPPVVLPSATGPAATQSTTGESFAELRKALDVFVRDGLTRLSAEFFGLVSTSIVVLIYVFFLLLGSVGTQSKEGPMREIDHQVRSYLFLKTIISVLTGAAFGLMLWIFGVPMALTFGVLAFLLNYIPNIGPLVASVLPIPFIILHPEGSLTWMIGAIGTTSLIQIISGTVVEPKLMGDSSDLHPVAILLALMFWGMMWGITGMFLATPITAGLKIILDRIDSTKLLANILAGRWEFAEAKKPKPS